MALSMTQFTHDPTYAPFLAAAVGADGTGAKVSVLSMLARLDVDPWVEAAKLAHLQDLPARQRLEELLTRFTDVPTRVSDQGRVASALLALLPRHTPAARVFAKPGSDLLTIPPAGAPIYWIIGTILVIGWIVSLAQGN